MASGERMESVEDVRQWVDSIPFHYRYTAGVAGEIFLRGLASGRLVGARCSRCNVTFVPPRTYCVECYGAVDRYVRVRPVGRVSATTTTRKGQLGEDLDEAVTFGYITFEGVAGGILHKILGRARVGSKVRARFRKRRERVRSILDLEGFEPLEAKSRTAHRPRRSTRRIAR